MHKLGEWYIAGFETAPSIDRKTNRVTHWATGARVNLKSTRPDGFDVWLNIENEATAEMLREIWIGWLHEPGDNAPGFDIWIEPIRSNTQAK